MISLDEDFIGWDSNSIVVHGLKVCGGLVCSLADHRLLGAHFTSITTPQEILTGCTWLMNHAANGAVVQDMYFVAKLAAWQGRQDKYANTHTLVSDLKIMFNFGGQIWVFDKDVIGHSVDVKLNSVSGLYYRVTPNPDPELVKPTDRVKFIKTQLRSTTPVVQDLGQGNRKVHRIQRDLSGWTLFSQGQMTPV
jgi:hypothetical protein